jgi:hypothetical protein
MPHGVDAGHDGKLREAINAVEFFGVDITLRIQFWTSPPKLTRKSRRLTASAAECRSPRSHALPALVNMHPKGVTTPFSRDKLLDAP